MILTGVEYRLLSRFVSPSRAGMGGIALRDGKATATNGHVLLQIDVGETPSPEGEGCYILPVVAGVQKGNKVLINFDTKQVTIPATNRYAERTFELLVDDYPSLETLPIKEEAFHVGFSPKYLSWLARVGLELGGAGGMEFNFRTELQATGFTVRDNSRVSGYIMPLRNGEHG